MGQYSKKGLYTGYKKNNAERDSLDYYSTPTEEVVNILKVINPISDMDNATILEPSCGGGHMAKGILTFFGDKHQLICTDVKDRGFRTSGVCEYGESFDFLSDDYKYNKADLIIMNPPFATIEPFAIRALEISPRVLLLGRTQFVEGEGRFNNIFKNTPPTRIYQYVDRIKCFKNGDLTLTESSAQAYSWFYWDANEKEKDCTFHWMRRSSKSI